LWYWAFGRREGDRFRRGLKGHAKRRSGGLRVGWGSVLHKGEYNATLWKAALDGAGETRVVEGVAHRGFAVRKDGVYYLRAGPDGEAIRHFRFKTGEDTRVARLAKRAYLGLSVSPDGRYAIYSQLDQQGTDLMLVERFR
jgi:hypothetical protein